MSASSYELKPITKYIKYTRHLLGINGISSNLRSFTFVNSYCFYLSRYLIKNEFIEANFKKVFLFSTLFPRTEKYVSEYLTSV